MLSFDKLLLHPDILTGLVSIGSSSPAIGSSLGGVPALLASDPLLSVFRSCVLVEVLAPY